MRDLQCTLVFVDPFIFQSSQEFFFEMSDDFVRFAQSNNKSSKKQSIGSNLADACSEML